jgi:hypothetical protein
LAGAKDLSLLHSIQASSGVHTASLSQGAKWLGHECDYLLPSGAQKYHLMEALNSNETLNLMCLSSEKQKQYPEMIRQ